MGPSAGTGPAILVSVLVVLGGVFVLLRDAASSVDTLAWVLIGVGVLFGVVNLALMKRGR
jgi:hypothetical protein